MSLEPEVLESSQRVRDQYFPEIKKLLLEKFPIYAEIVYMDHNVSSIESSIRSRHTHEMTAAAEEKSSISQGN
jgi:hypothetical protein